MKRRPPRSTLFPYTPLFRSLEEVNMPAEDEEREAMFGELDAYMDAQIDDHIAHPRDDLTSFLIGAEIGGSKLSRERSEEHTSELQSQSNLVCRLLLEKYKSKSNNDSTGAVEQNRQLFRTDAANCSQRIRIRTFLLLLDFAERSEYDAPRRVLHDPVRL